MRTLKLTIRATFFGHVRYYTLIVACVLWKKSELLKKACLAAALIFPAVAAIHGIVLAALHRDGKGVSPRTYA